MPFGLPNATATSQRTLEILLGRYKWWRCVVYLEHIIAFSGNLDHHLGHGRLLMNTLQDTRITLKLRKFDFFTDFVKYLGHIIHPGELLVEEARIKSLKKARPLTAQTEPHFVLGLCNVYRCFIPRFAKIMGPINQYLREGQPPKLGPFTFTQVDAYYSFKEAVTAALVVLLPKNGFPFTVDTKSSEYQIGCVLFQTTPDGEGRPIGSWSRTLNFHERNFPVFEKECLAMVWALQTLLPYSMGAHFTVNTHHASLRSLM